MKSFEPMTAAWLCKLKEEAGVAEAGNVFNKPHIP